MSKSYTKEEIIEALTDEGYEISETPTALCISWEGTHVVLKNTDHSIRSFFNDVFGLQEEQ